MIGQTLGPYQVLSKLGEGGMGEVYRATDTKLGRDVALKILPEAFAQDAGRLARFRREAQVLAALNHPGIAHIYGLEEADGRSTLVMELVEGPTLADRIAQGPIPIDEALPLAKQIAEALEAAHEQGIIHRDLKPANIKVREDGTVKVLDFGLAKALGPEGASAAAGVSAGQALSQSPTITTPAMTEMGMILGTAAYMSPEQARGKPVDKRTDIWAFGCVLFEMLTARRLFQGEDVTETLAAVVKEHPDFSGMHPAARRVLERCLEKNPKTRLRDISGVQLLLEVEPPVADTRAGRRPGRLPWIAAGIATLAAAGMAVQSLRPLQGPGQKVMRFEIRPPEGGQFGSFVQVSPDGRLVAFRASGGGESRSRVWVRALDALEARPLPGTEGGSIDGFFWLSDSRTLVFGSAGRLRKIDVRGGPAQSICDSGTDNPGGGFLTADSQIVFGTPATLGIQKCPANGGDAAPVTTFAPGGQEAYHAFPVLLPNGVDFLYLRRAGPNTGIYVGSLEARPEEQAGRRVLPDLSAPLFVPGPRGDQGTILFVREGILMAQGFDLATLELIGGAVPLGDNVSTLYSFSVSEEGTLVYLTEGRSDAQLTWFDRQLSPLDTVGGPGQALAAMRISFDGSRVAGVRAESGEAPDIWVVDLARGSETRLTTDPGYDASPVWAPDGARIAFASAREGSFNLYVRAADGAGADELLLRTGERKNPMDWSRDGKFLLFRVLSSTGSDVWVLPLDDETGIESTPLPYLRTAANESGARFSPDGRFVAYVSDESGSSEVYVRPFDAASPEASGTGGGRVKVSQDGGVAAQWGPDGRELFYLTLEDELWSVEVAADPELRTGVPQLLGTLPQGSGVMAPDGQRVLVAVPTEERRRSATVLVNWQATLRE